MSVHDVSVRPEADEHEILIPVSALHALKYCERLFYLEQVEGIQLADESVYAGRALHEGLRQSEDRLGWWTSLELGSERLGLVGKVDCLREKDGSLVPYEHKRGRARRDGATLLAWPSDMLQVSAYGMLVEEETGLRVREGRVRYHEDGATVPVVLDDAARSAVLAAVHRARELHREQTRPPVPENDRLCTRCSLAPACLPEEERLLEDPEWEPVRLFPPDRELKTMHVISQGARLSRAGDSLRVETPEGEVKVFAVREIGSVVLHGFSQITTQALHFCVQNGIAVHWVSAGYQYVAGLTAGAGHVRKRLRQYHALADPGTCLRLARRVVTAKIESALRYVLRACRSRGLAWELIAEPVEQMRACLRKASHTDTIESLRGLEGVAAQAYFSALPNLFRPEVPEEMRFSGRNRRPPRDRFNALLSFGYALVYQTVLQAVQSVGLEPSLGFFHTPRSYAHPLVLDLMELFRVPLWDMVVVASINRLQWEPTEDFQVAGDRVWLSQQGRKKAIQLFERRLDETWKHPVISYSLSYLRLVELETRLLEKEWSGQPGLFAKMRLR